MITWGFTGSFLFFYAQRVEKNDFPFSLLLPHSFSLPLFIYSRPKVTMAQSVFRLALSHWAFALGAITHPLIRTGMQETHATQAPASNQARLQVVKREEEIKEERDRKNLATSKTTKEEKGEEERREKRTTRRICVRTGQTFCTLFVFTSPLISWSSLTYRRH